MVEGQVYEFIRFEVHDGHTAFFWVDDWLQVGKLIDITGPIGTCHLRIDRHARVRDAAGNSSWNIRGHRSRYFQELIDRIQTVQLPHETLGHDVALWKHSDDNYKPYFSASSTWEQGVPRFSFILWLAVKNRLSTGDRMRVWGIQQGCVLCGERDETRDHLFFACPYSFTVWDKLVNRLTGNGTDPDWMGFTYMSSDVSKWDYANPPQTAAIVMVVSDFVDSISHCLVRLLQENNYNLFLAISSRPSKMSFLLTSAEWLWESLLAAGSEKRRILLQKCSSKSESGEPTATLYCKLCHFGTKSIDIFRTHLSTDEKHAEEEKRLPASRKSNIQGQRRFRVAEYDRHHLPEVKNDRKTKRMKKKANSDGFWTS
ncbi:PREDICTED: uncharacterized protein LOC106324453 [Brassica oleracea var. oleracea]|uniref:uncharacterized protein LOC106324453 n=1 Tax=Brassica oleracea var. oleracea TaxID=109376 RepID=UPI0006A70FCF|nr:PREDICTED: uncharacterized protein LOC106324453 [Brassica oleracea var. oleracea]